MEDTMSLRLGDIAPDFEQDSSEGRIQFHAWLGNSWGVLFSHPADFTPVCTTELGLTAKLKDAFAKRNVKVIALSVDPVDSHKKWIDDINETQNTRVNFPIIADADRKVSQLYDMIHPNASETFTVRSLFVIDPNKKVRLTITYPASTGRNFDEVLRVIDSLQLTDHHSVATPGNWKDGDDVVIVPSLKDEEVIKQKFPKGYKAVRPYLRLTPQPNK
ncbi:alkyl hydroperoxide reductase subunit C [Ralstonia solanacearum Po82]|nr:alkyl hydroperoxide reductase subunit C [Ralstonia solanacearum Po82]